MNVRPRLGRDVPGFVFVFAPTEVDVTDDAEVVGARRGAGVGIGLDGIGILLMYRIRKSYFVSRLSQDAGD